MSRKKEVIKQKHIPFALPDIGEEEIESVTNCIRSGWMTTGPNTKQFESDFSNYIGDNVHAISVNSATSGLLLALEAVGVSQGDEVITTPYTFSATAMVCVHLGAVPVLVDIEEDSYNISPSKIEDAITDKTKAIIPVHFAGLACNMDAIIKIAREYDLKVVEDAAHALPSTSNGQVIGALDTDATIYSFYATKTITTGEGGMIVTKDDEIAARCKTMRLHGISRDVFDRYTSTKPVWFYEITAPGFKANMTDISASIGIAQLKKATDFQIKRQYIKEKYSEAFKDLPITLPKESEDGNVHSWHLFVIRLNDDAPVSRDDFIKKMAEEHQIGCSVHFIPLNFHPYWQEKLGVNEDSFPIAKKVFEKSVSLPIYTKMTDEDIDRVITAVNEILSP